MSLSNQFYERGGCYTWTQRTGYTTANLVSCSSPHLFEAVSAVRLTGRNAPITYPSKKRWVAIERRVCGPLDAAFLNDPIEPDGKYYPGIIKPLHDGWLSGDRNGTCGIDAFSSRYVGQKNRDLLATFSGAVNAAQQAQLYAPGTCLVYGRGAASGSVPCRRPHDYVAVGTATATGSNADPPTASAFLATAAPGCQAMASTYLHRTFTQTQQSRTAEQPTKPVSWRAGRRTYNCLVGFYDSANASTMVTGRLH